MKEIVHKRKYTILNYVCDKFSKLLLFFAHLCLSKKRKRDLNQLLDKSEENSLNAGKAQHIINKREKLETIVGDTLKEINALKVTNEYYYEGLKKISIGFMEEDNDLIAKVLSEYGLIKGITK